MKNLKILIKIRKHNINEIVQRIILLETHRNSLEEKFVQLMAQINYETAKFNYTEYGFALDNYLIEARNKKQIYIHGIGITEMKIQEAQAQLHEEFGEMKKLEIALQNRIQEAKAEEEMAEMNLIDDINIVRGNMRNYYNIHG